MATSKLDYVPSHMTDGQYAILMETSGDDVESWYYFIRVDGNEENLKHLQAQLESVEWYILDDFSTFDLEMEHFVSAQTAKEMTKVDLNHSSFHRKFDGVLQKIDIKFKRKDSNDRKIERVFKALGDGKIDEYIDDEDIDEEDLVTDNEEEDSEEDGGEEESEEDSCDEEVKKPKTKYKIPPMLIK